MKPFHDSASISAKLTRMTLVVSGAVLLLSVLTFLSFDLISFRQDLIRNLETEAQIIGANSVSALLFDDQQSAGMTLRGLHSSPDVLAAILTTNDGGIFAKYEAHDAGNLLMMPALTRQETERYWASGRHLVLAHRIMFEGKSVGVVYIVATLTEIGQRVRQYLLIAGAILLFCMAAALLISSTSRRLIARPIISLAETARFVSREKDYSVRAAPHFDRDEIAVLIDAFNEMLVQIQQRDTALSRARDELEMRVQERTADLQAANRELEAFSYTVAHDLRGPLDSVNGITFVLQRTYQDRLENDGKEMLEQLRMATGNMASLIDDLLNFSRASTTSLKRGPVDLSMLARQIADELKLVNPERNVEFVIAGLPDAHADKGLMRVVLDNLIRNAWKYTSHHDHACIEFGATRVGQELVYFVRDDGVGFDPKMIDRLFQPFHRLHSKSDFPGTGIGLATVQRILARHDGRIWAEGAVEKGATFYFTL